MKKRDKLSWGQDRKNSSSKSKSQKPYVPVWDFGLSDFSRTDRIRLEFKILFVLKRFFCIRVKELRPATYINIGYG
jgi:hypothetical protein